MAFGQPVVLVDQFGNYVAAGGGGGGGSTNIAQIGGAPYGLGPNTSANSQSVVFATDALMSITGSVTATGTMTLGASSGTNIGNVGLLAGTQVIGGINISQITPATTNGVQCTASPNGGFNTTSVIISSTTATVVKATAGVVFGVSIDNNSAGPIYAKLYNAATATVGTGTPLQRWMCPGPTNGGGGCRDWQSTIGATFNTGICLICTQLQADADTTAVPAGTVTVTIFWK